MVEATCRNDLVTFIVRTSKLHLERCRHLGYGGEQFGSNCRYQLEFQIKISEPKKKHLIIYSFRSLDLVLENMVTIKQISAEARNKVKEALLRRHRHQHERRHDRNDSKNRLPIIRSLADIGRNSSKSMFGSHSKFYHFFCLLLS